MEQSKIIDMLETYQSAGHKADDYETRQYCFICNKTNHPMTMRWCPALKLPKPVAMLCSYGTENIIFSDAQQCL